MSVASYRFEYTNYRGETSVRSVVPHRVFYGSAPPYHPAVGWYMDAFDLDKGADRCFDLSQIRRLDGSVTAAELGAMLRDARSKAPVYVAGPYAHPSAEVIAENVRRAVHIGNLCLTIFTNAPILVPHALGHAGLYGASADDGRGSASRTMALQQGGSWAAMAGRLGGALVVILQDDGTPSSGTAVEIDAFRDAGGDRIIRGTYDQLRGAFNREHHRRRGAVIVAPTAADMAIHTDVGRVWPAE